MNGPMIAILIVIGAFAVGALIGWSITRNL